MTKRNIEVPGWAKPKGYENGVAKRGEVLAIAGQIGWNAEQVFETDDLIAQFGKALENVVAVVRAAGGTPDDLTSMTVFVTDIEGYRARTKELGPVWREKMGRVFPAMALVGVTALVEPRAKVEIVATAVLGD